jgi:ribonuclease BN (tRNA processing enzyme)
MLWPMPRPRVVFLGTGGALNHERYQPAILVEHGDTRVLLDTGGGLGLVRRLLAARVDPASVGHVFLSHRHLDHMGGLEPLLLTMSLRAFHAGTTPSAVALYALPASAAAIRATLAAADGAGERRLAAQLSWISPDAGSPVALAAGVALTLAAVDHLPVGGGAAGCEVVAGSARVVYSGDTRPCDALVDLARGADLLIHEVGGLDARASVLHQVGHSTAAEAGRIAARAGVRALALFHLPSTEWASPGDLLAEARSHAPGVEVFVSEDGMSLGV